MTRLVLPQVSLNVIIPDAVQQARGLSGWPSLPEDHGMLFVSPTPKFWELHTRLMNFPLDFVFLRHEHLDSHQYAHTLTVCSAYYDVAPGRSDIVSGDRVRFVLEVNGGWIRRHGVVWGQRATVTDDQGRNYVL